MDVAERDYKTISFIIPTIGRESLNDTLASIGEWPGDEVLVIRHNPPSNNWGNAERQEGTDKAKGDYLAYIDDDDVYVPGARKIMDSVIKENPGVPILFRIQFPSGRTLPRKKWIKNGNLSTQMILVPNNKEMLYEWDQRHHWADYYFIKRWKWSWREIIWRPEVLVMMGHDDEKHERGMSISEAKKEGILR